MLIIQNSLTKIANNLRKRFKLLIHGGYLKSNKFLHLFFLLLISSIGFFGCSEDNNPTNGDGGPDPITEDPFPMQIGRQLTYNGFLRDKSTDQDITSYTAYMASWTVISNSAPVPNVGGTSNLVMDSTLAPTGMANPPVAWVTTPFFIRRDPPTGNANFSFLQNLGPFYRRFGITPTDTLVWINLAQLDKGAGVEYTAFDSSWTTSVGEVRLEIVGKLQADVSVNVNGTDYNTYYLTTIRKVYAGGTVIQEAPTASLWLAPNIGPVKMIINADGENFGHTRNLVSKNF